MYLLCINFFISINENKDLYQDFETRFPPIPFSDNTGKGIESERIASNWFWISEITDWINKIKTRFVVKQFDLYINRLDLSLNYDTEMRFALLRLSRNINHLLL